MNYLLGDIVRPALIVSVPSASEAIVNLQVFTDGKNDEARLEKGEVGASLVWRTSVPHDLEGKVPGSWRWPEAGVSARVDQVNARQAKAEAARRLLR